MVVGPIDLRSDTVTRPTPGMREAMARAEVGDDVYSEDPTINRLQEIVAARLGKEAALYVPSGTMSNQIGIKAHTQPGDEMLCETTCHVYTWEAGAPAVLSGVTCRTIDGDSGVLHVDQVRDKIRPQNDHYVRTRLVSLENTHNRGGGRVYPQDAIQSISDWAHENGLMMHLDGARLWNAAVATGHSLATLAAPFDTVSVCFSKGLGAPIGSALVGPREFIARAKRIRKLFGGAMRQGGIVAAAALYALEHHFDRLAEDHRHAQILADAVESSPGLSLEFGSVETNLVWIVVDPQVATPKAVVDALRARGVWMSALGSRQIRACTHLDVSMEEAMYAAEQLRAVMQEMAAIAA